MSKQYDLNDDSVFVVIGSGAGGGTLANELAQKGIDVVCLEAGKRLTFGEIEQDPAVMHERMGWLGDAIVFGKSTIGGKKIENTMLKWLFVGFVIVLPVLAMGFDVGTTQL